MRTRLVAITFLLLAAPPLPSAAQSGIASVALLTGASTSDLATAPTWQPFIEALRQRGRTEGDNLEFHHRWTGGRDERWPQLAAELVALGPNLIIAVGSQATQAARAKTDTIPIVMIGVADPIGSGFVASLARPGGNVTGLSAQLGDTNEKALQLLIETRPGMSRIGLFWLPNNSGSKLSKESLVVIAPRLGATIEPVAINAAEDFDAAFATIARSRPDALFTHSGPLLFEHRREIIDFALDHRLPAIGTSTAWARDGLLMSYAWDEVAAWRRAADYVDRILKGAKPAELPVEQPTKFEFVINLKTAGAIGLDLPYLFIARADEVIE
jgi:putative ABC transport system substrate-binding protein